MIVRCFCKEPRINPLLIKLIEGYSFFIISINKIMYYFYKYKIMEEKH